MAQTKTKTKKTTKQRAVAPTKTDTKSSQDLIEDIDSVLDEIDTVLEANALDFVRGFIQKGGE